MRSLHEHLQKLPNVPITVLPIPHCSFDLGMPRNRGNHAQGNLTPQAKRKQIEWRREQLCNILFSVLVSRSRMSGRKNLAYPLANPNGPIHIHLYERHSSRTTTHCRAHSRVLSPLFGSPLTGRRDRRHAPMSVAGS